MTEPTDPPREQAALPTGRNLLALGSRPVDLIAHSAWSEARETVLALVNAGPALIALLGSPGTGKTALLRDLATSFGELGRAVCLLDSGDSPLDVGPAEIVLVDEADRISVTRVEEFRSRTGVAVVLAALPGSRERFECFPDASVVQLAPLSPDEACKFVAERLAQLGLPSACLTEEAWARLIAQSRGVPRLLVGFLGFALFIAGEEHAACVTASHVDEAIEVRGGDPAPGTVEPALAEPDQTQECVAEAASGTEVACTDAGLDWIGARPRRRLPSKVVVSLYLATVAACYLVPAAALLTWHMHWQMDQTTSSEFNAPAVDRTHVLAPAAAGAEQVTAAAPTATVATPPGIGVGSAGPGAAGAAKPVQLVSPPPVAVAMGSENAAAPQSVPEFQAPTAATGKTEDLPSSKLPSRVVAPTAQHVGPPAWASERAPPMRDRSLALKDASGSDQRDAAERVLPTQIQELPGEFAEANSRVAKAQHQALRREPYRRPASMPVQTTTREPRLPVRQLLSARRALVDHHSSEARGLLEAAQTTIVFEPGGIAHGHTGIAAAQIANALSMLNSGNAVSAVPYLDLAIKAMRPTS